MSSASSAARWAPSAFRIAARVVVPGERLVHTEAYDPGNLGDAVPENAVIVTVRFDDTGGQTTVTTLIDFGSKEARDAAVASGMTDGMEQSHQLLDQMLDRGTIG